MGDGRVRLELRGPSVTQLGGDIAGFGKLVEVLGPPDLRERMALLGAELSGLYG
jgi:predicted DNA-binding transcriptional regulator YafY